MNNVVLMLLVAGTVNAVHVTAADASPGPSRIVTDVQFGTGGFPTTQSTIDYSYDADGNVLDEVHQTYFAGTPTFRMTITSTYDGPDRPLTRRLQRDLNADGVINDIETTTWAYDAAGQTLTRVLVVEHSGSTATATHTTRYTYDGRGRLSSETTDVLRDADGDIDRLSVIVYTYDPRGHQSVRREVIFDDMLSSPLGTTHLYSYDARGHRVGELFGMDEGLDGAPDSLRLTATAVNLSGLVLAEVQVDDLNVDGNVDSASYRSRRYTDDVLLEELFRLDSGANGTIDLTTHRTFSYDESGRLTQRITVHTGTFVNQTETTQYFY